MIIPRQENVTQSDSMASASQLKQLRVIGWNCGSFTASPNARPLFVDWVRQPCSSFIGVDSSLNSGPSPRRLHSDLKWTKAEDVHHWHSRSCLVPLIFPALLITFMIQSDCPPPSSPCKDLESAQLLVLIMFLLHLYRLQVQVRLSADLGERWGRRDAGRMGGGGDYP